MHPPLAVLPTLIVLAVFFCGPAVAETARSAPPAAPPPAPMPDNDAAARHAKRTACLQEAKSRKLLGAQKAAFLKECFAAP